MTQSTLVTIDSFTAPTRPFVPVKAKALDDDEREAWFAGRTPWRMLAIPFGGPIVHPKAPRGVDLDGQWFSENTDIFGGYKVLRDTPERLLDWHHGTDGMMGRTVIGKSILDPDPDADGWWVDVWLKAGEKRLSLVKRLAERGAQLFGSAEPITAGKADAETGEITYFPWLRHTLSTSPQNTLAIVRPKALIAELDDNPSLTVGSALRAFLTELDARGADLPAIAADPAIPAAKAGRVLSANSEQTLRELLDRLTAWLEARRHQPIEETESGEPTQ